MELWALARGGTVVHWAPDLTRVLRFLCPGTAELLGELQPQAILFLGF